MTTLGQLRAQVASRLGDVEAAIWTGDEIDLHLVDGYQQIANTLGVFWDQAYLENRPAAFSVSQTWELAFLGSAAPFTVGVANFTYEDERRLLGDERLRLGPANYTSPFEFTDGHLSDAGADTSIPATADLPKTVTALDRVTWDARGIDAMEARTLSRMDARYELTVGEVYGYIWQKDGIRTLRKVRVPGQPSDNAQIDGAWGLLRNPADLADDTVTGTWGVPRRIPGHHPIGPDTFGAPRRPFLDGKNVRVEHFRQGRALDSSASVCELPDRYAVYLRDYAMALCLGRRGPGQDLKLAAHFQQRWDRAIARIQRRLQVVDAERVSVIGGDGRPSVSRPPRPSLPWQYGSRVR